MSDPTRAPLYPPPTRVRWQAGRVALTGTVQACEWDTAQHAYRYTVGDVRGAAITTATLLESALRPDPTKEARRE